MTPADREALETADRVLELGPHWSSTARDAVTLARAVHRMAPIVEEVADRDPAPGYAHCWFCGKFKAHMPDCVWLRARGETP